MEEQRRSKESRVRLQINEIISITGHLSTARSIVVTIWSLWDFCVDRWTTCCIRVHDPTKRKQCIGTDIGVKTPAMQLKTTTFTIITKSGIDPDIVTKNYE